MTQSPVTIRHARTTGEDLDRIAELNFEVQQMHVKREPDIFRQPTPEEVARKFGDILTDGGGHGVLLAERRSQVIGYLFYELSDRPASTFTHSARILYVHQIGVDAAYRGRGVGRALLDAARQEGAEAGATRMGLDTWAFNEGALRFFEACGFEPFQVRLRRDVKAPIRPAPRSDDD